MLIIYGRKSANIKSDINHEHVCSNCNKLDLGIKVYRDYFHIFFLPFFPISYKEVKIRCNNCGEPKYIEPLQKQYEKSTRTPFYMYTWLILIGGLILFGLVANFSAQKENAQLVADPHIGDVYAVRQHKNDTIIYYFLKVSRINGDTIVVYHNNFVYYGSMNKFNEDDFFIEGDEYSFMREDLKEMFEKDEINSVYRNYSALKGFNRIK